MIRETFKNYVHIYRNSLYMQMKGGAIGLRLTRVVAKVVIDSWARRFVDTLAQADIAVYLLRNYVDDINLATGLLEKG